jgi:MFS family permease
VSRSSPPPAAAGGGAPGASPTRRLLVDRTFGPWFWGNVVSNSGNWLFNVTAAVVVYQLSRSALLVGLVSVAQFGPLVLFSPLAGALTDRVDRRRLLLTAQSVSTLAASVLAIVMVLVGVDGLPGPWPILATALAMGTGNAFSAPALNALVPALVEDRDLESGVALTSLTFNVGRAFGPASSGVFLATVGAEAAFVANAVSFLALIAALLVITPRPRAPRTGGDRSMRAGFRYVRGDRTTLLLLVGVGATGFAVDPMITLAPPLAEALGGGDTLVAMLVTAFGVAAVPSALVSGRLQRAAGSLRVAGAGALVSASGLSVAAVAPTPPLAILGFAITGVGFVLAVTGFTTTLQRRVPDELRGRVMALWSVSYLGNRPIAAMIDGTAADLVGPRWAMAVAITVAGSGALLAARLVRREPTG